MLYKKNIRNNKTDIKKKEKKMKKNEMNKKEKWKPYGWRLNGYSTRNMNCVITTCTRKTTHWNFKTLEVATFEKVRENSTGEKKYEKKYTGK